MFRAFWERVLVSTTDVRTLYGAGVDEDTAYVYVDFSGIKSNLLPTVGERVSIKVRCSTNSHIDVPNVHPCFDYMLAQGLDSAAPEVEVGDGTLLRGKYEDSIGSLMFFAREEKDPSSNPRPMDEGQSTGTTHQTRLLVKVASCLDAMRST